MGNNRVANRKGLKTRIYKYSDGSLYTAIDYGNVTVIEHSADRTWATGGQNQNNEVAFDNPITGTFKISSQMIPLELIALAASDKGVQESSDMSVVETVTCTVAGSLTLTKTPIPGGIAVYPAGASIMGSIPKAATYSGTGMSITGETTDFVKDQKYDVYYFTSEADANSVTFNDNNNTGVYRIDSDTVYKQNDGEVIAEQVQIFKATPQKGISMTYQGGTNDPMSIDITFDYSADANGDVIKYIRK